MRLDTIRVFAISKLGWIKQQQRKLREQDRETPREYMDRESHYVWGKRYLLKVVEEHAEAKVVLRRSKIVLREGSATSHDARQAIIAQWYRDQIKNAVPDMIAKWEPIIGVKVNRIFVQKMKTKWGSCNAASLSIRLNTDLAKKPPECLEYILVHEMVHLLERRHNERFRGYMDLFMPHWRGYRDEPNRAPLNHETWGY